MYIAVKSIAQRRLFCNKNKENPSYHTRDGRRMDMENPLGSERMEVYQLEYRMI